MRPQSQLSQYGTTIPANYPTSLGNVPNWIPVRLSGTDGAAPVNEAYSSGTAPPYTLGSPTASHLVNAINCFDHPGGTGTNLAEPLRMAQAELAADPRNVTKGILLETDGQPDNASNLSPTSDFTCAGDIAAATAVKNAGIQLYTVGFGLDGSNDIACPDNHSMDATGNLAAMASPQSNGSPSPDLGCPSPGNILTLYPGDHAFCEVKSADGDTLLAAVFQYVAENLASSGLHLVNLYPQPVLTSINPTTGSLTTTTTVTITGKFFTGATSVTGTTSFTVVSDTSITAVMPKGTGAGTFNIQVTTPGGSSPIVSADQFTYP
jgi:hypothetical protein